MSALVPTEERECVWVCRGGCVGLVKRERQRERESEVC